jgi:adenylate cyclase class 2
MSFEVEIKYRNVDPGDLETRLARLGAQAGATIDQEDLYLNHPARDFARSGEVLRLRREGTRHKITYKGPRQGGPTKTREEIEIGYDGAGENPPQMRRVWEQLGFRPVALLRKQRRPFHLVHQGRPVEVVLDLAEDLGTFAEVETIAHDDADLPAAQAAVVDLAQQLGLTEVEPRSYLRMNLEKTGGVGPGQPAEPGS